MAEKNILETIGDYSNIKHQLNNRAIIYEEIIPYISDELGFKYFNFVLQPPGSNSIFAEIQFKYFLIQFHNMERNYDTETRNVYFEIAMIIFSSKNYYNYLDIHKNGEEDDFDNYIDKIEEGFKEFNQKAITEIGQYEYTKLRNGLESGKLIALAFNLINCNAIEKEYLPSFCKALEEWIIYISHTQFYVSETRDWMEKIFGTNE